jgi:DNA replication protein DnaC
MRYHLVKKWIPEGELLEIRNAKDSKILYFKDETSWTTVLASLEKVWYKRWKNQPWIGWEIRATKESVRYFIWVPNLTVKRDFLNKFYAEHEDYVVNEVNDEKIDFTRIHQLAKFKLKQHWVLPIKTYHNEVVDSQAELISLLSDLQEDEEVRIQFLIRPAYKTSKKFTQATKILEKTLEKHLNLEDTIKLKKAAIQGKKSRLLADTSIRAVAFAEDQVRANQLLQNVSKALGTFQSGDLNEFQAREHWLTLKKLFTYEFENRIFPLDFRKTILSAEELGNVLRLPSERVQSNKLNRLMMRYTPLPTQLKNYVPSACHSIIGNHSYRGREKDIPLDLETLRYHLALIGVSGAGKSTLLHNLAEDIINIPGFGMTVIDPHGELCQDIAARIPTKEHHRVRYVRFSDGTFPFNIYDIDFSLGIDQIAKNVADVFKRTYKDFWGPNVADNFINGGILLQIFQQANIGNLQHLLEDKQYQFDLVDQLNEDVPIQAALKRYFKSLLALNDRDYQSRVNSTLNKIRGLNLSSTIGPMLNAHINGIKWRESLDKGYINLLDLSNLPTDEKKFIGGLCLTMAELAAKSRADQTKEVRKELPYHVLIVDEAPTLMENSKEAIESFSSELRKYKVCAVLGMQGLKGQVPPEVIDAIFRNFGTFVSFRLGHPYDAEFVQKSLNYDFLTTSDYMDIELFHAYVRLQIGSERTKPFLVKMKPPTPILNQDITEFIMKAVEEAQQLEAVERKRIAVEEEEREQREMKRQQTERPKGLLQKDEEEKLTNTLNMESEEEQPMQLAVPYEESEELITVPGLLE